MHIANIYVSYIFKCFPKVKEHWLIHKINGENVLNEHQDDIVELLQEAKRPIKITFLHPNHELHPHNHHHHHHHREHTSTITLLDGEKLWFNMKFVDHEFEESYMIIIKVSTDNMQHIRENLKLAYVLSGIGVHHAFNVEEVDIHNYIKNEVRPVQLVFLTPNHPMHPYNHNHFGMKPNTLHTVYSKCRHHWQSASVEDLEKICSTYPEKLKTFDENGWLPIHYAIYHNSNLDVLEYLISRNNGCLSVPNDEGDLPLHLAVFWGRKKTIIDYIMRLHPDAINVRTNSGLTIYDLARDSHFCSKEIKDFFTTLEKEKEIGSKNKTSEVKTLKIENTAKQNDISNNKAVDKIDDKLPTLDIYGRHAIHLVIKKGSGNFGGIPLLDSVKQIVDNEPKCIYLKDEEGETPLHYAAYYGKDILIPYLLYLHPKAAEMKTFTMEYTPLDLARSVSNFSNKKCIELLEDIEGTVFSYRNAKQRDGK